MLDATMVSYTEKTDSFDEDEFWDEFDEDPREGKMSDAEWLAEEMTWD